MGSSVKKRDSKPGLNQLVKKAYERENAGGTTDGLSTSRRFVGRIVHITPNCDGAPFEFVSERYGDREARCFVYKIKLEQELGNSDMGYELLYDDIEQLATDAAYGTLDTPGEALRKQLADLGVTDEKFANLQKNLLPEGVYVEDTNFELPAVGDKIMATPDGGIEGRYLIEPLPGANKANLVRNLANAHSRYAADVKSGKIKGYFDKTTGKLIKQRYDVHLEPITDSGNPKRKQTIAEFVANNILHNYLSTSPALIRSDYGLRSGGSTGGESKMHNGIDIAVPDTKTPFYAPADGIVTLAIFQDEWKETGDGSRWKNGNMIKFLHADNASFAPKRTSYFLHLHDISDKIRPLSPGIEAADKATITSIEDIDANHIMKNKAGEEVSKAKEGRIGEARNYTPGGTKTRAANTPKFPMGYTQVKKGTLLGFIGNSGRSAGIHLHWQFATASDPYLEILKYNNWLSGNTSDAESEQRSSLPSDATGEMSQELTSE